MSNLSQLIRSLKPNDLVKADMIVETLASSQNPLDLTSYEQRWQREVADAVRKEWEEEHGIRRRIGYSSLSQDEWNIIFEKLQPNAHINRVRGWNPKMKQGAILYGPPGTGKSTLGKALINQWANEDYRALFITVGDALDNIRNAFEDKETSVELEMDKLRNPELLFLDDFGAEKQSEFADEKIFAILDHRTRNNKHLWLSTNLTPDDLKKRYHKRIFDRLLMIGTWIECNGTSYRLKGFKSEF